MTLALVISLPFMVVLFEIGRALDGWGLTPSVLALTRPYLDALTWSVPPLLLLFRLSPLPAGHGRGEADHDRAGLRQRRQRRLQLILIHGHFGAPAMGVRGSAWATVLARVMMAALLLGVIVVRERGRRPGLFETRLRLEAPAMRGLIALGLPAALQITLEVGVFASATALAGRLPAVALAAHQIAVNIAAFTFMVPLGVASAAAVRVGHAVGRRDLDAASRAGWTALVLGTMFMTCSALSFLVVPRALIGGFTSDSQVMAIGVRLLTVGAIFQLFDGVQAVATGALRGLGDTRTAMTWNLAGHWFVGLPLGYALCFVLGLGVVGLWWGLTSGLVICGIALLSAWSRRIAAAPGLLSESDRRYSGMADQDSRTNQSSAEPREENASQRQSDATPDVVGGREIAPPKSPTARAGGARTPTARRLSMKSRVTNAASCTRRG